MKSEIPSGPQPPAIRVLLIEDNPGDAKIIQRLLNSVTDGELDLHHEADLESGIEWLRSKGADVLLLDLGLPPTNGLDTLVRANQRIPDIPKIILSGNDVPPTILEAIKAGAKDYLVKSRIDGRRLLETILRVLSRSYPRK